MKGQRKPGSSWIRKIIPRIAQGMVMISKIHIRTKKRDDSRNFRKFLAISQDAKKISGCIWLWNRSVNIMNELPGKISHSSSLKQFMHIRHFGSLHRKLKLFSLRIPAQNQQLKDWLCDVQVLFKETEVIIAQAGDLKISLSNQLSCVVSAIQTGELLTRVQLKLEEYTINSLIISSHLKPLNLKVGDQVFVLIKSNEIMIAPK